MTIEQIEIRKLLSQMLADEGINRETIKGIVRDVVNEKVNRAIDDALHQIDLYKQIEYLFDNIVKYHIRSEIITAIKNKVITKVDKMKMKIDIYEENSEDNK